MTDVRKTVARLFPSGMRYDGAGGGGIPELTAQDIAGALGMVRNRFGRELFCALWWPDGAQSSAQAMDHAIRQMQLAEWLRRARLVEAARLALHMADDEATGTHGGIQGVQRAVSRARSELADAVRERWPKYGARYGLIRAAVLGEMAAPHQCTRCAGRGHVRDGSLVRPCTVCAGTGRGNNSDQKRAQRIDVSRNVYLRDWASVYQWTFNECTDAEQCAAVELAARLGRQG